MYLAVLLAACSCGDAFTRLWAWHDWVKTTLHMRVNTPDRPPKSHGLCWVCRERTANSPAHGPRQPVSNPCAHPRDSADAASWDDHPGVIIHRSVSFASRAVSNMRFVYRRGLLLSDAAIDSNGFFIV